MKLKLDLHPIYGDSQKIESELARVIDEAVLKRATEVEIIPGKGSGALKKTVIRFLDRPDVKSRYHRVEKDSDNWGRLFVHFKHERAEPGRKSSAVREPRLAFDCACCGGACSAATSAVEEASSIAQSHSVECPSCGTPNRVAVWLDRKGSAHCKAELGYE